MRKAVWRPLGWAVLIGSLFSGSFAQVSGADAQPRHWEVRYQIPQGLNPFYAFPSGCIVDTESVQVVYEPSRQPLQRVESNPGRGEFCLRTGRILFGVEDAGARVAITFLATPKRALVLTPVNESALDYLSKAAQAILERELSRRGYALVSWQEVRPLFAERKLTPDWLLHAAKCDTVSELPELAQAIGFDILVMSAVGTQSRAEIRYQPRPPRDPHRREPERRTPDEYEAVRVYNLFVDCAIVLYDGDSGRALLRRSLHDSWAHPSSRRAREIMLERLIQTAFRDYFGD
jgi:hypothetical protein